MRLKQRETKILLVAGDPSGDLHAAGVVKALRHRIPGLRVFGMGGPALARAGMDVREDLTRQALVGFTEVAKHFPKILSLFKKCELWLHRERPDLVLLVDYPGFNLRLATKAHALGIPVCYYIAPQVWAWHQSRLKDMRRDLTQVLCIIPFEEKFFREKGLDATYVGNPLVERIPRRFPAKKKILRSLSIPSSWKPLIGAMPGSRKAEVKRIWPVFLKAFRQLKERFPNAGMVVPRSAQLPEGYFNGLVPEDAVRFVPAPGYAARKVCDLTWVKSGTSTLETAILDVPMIIAYRVSALSGFLARRFLKLKYVGMVNLLSRHPIVPELLQGDADPEKIEQASVRLLSNKSARQRQLRQFAEVRRSLGSVRHPSEATARAILELLKGQHRANR